MRLIQNKPNAESKLYGVLQSQFACRRNIWQEKPVRHFCASRGALNHATIASLRDRNSGVIGNCAEASTLLYAQ
jgi:hypothetical protein